MLLLAPYENDAERRLLAAHLDAEMEAFRQATGRTAAYSLHARAAPGRPTYRDWLVGLQAAAFRGRDDRGVELPCAGAHVVAASHDDVAVLRHAWRPLDGLLAGTIARADFLDHGIDDVRMPPSDGAPAAQLALPWRRGTCSDSFQHLASVRPGGLPVGAEEPDAVLIVRLLGTMAQRARYDLRDGGTEGARLAYPSLAAPYASGWPSDGTVVAECPQPKVLRASDPALIQRVVAVARSMAGVLDGAVDALGAGAYSDGPDWQNPVYTLGSAAGVTDPGASDLMIVATKMLMSRPMTRSALDDRMATREGVIVGQLTTLAAARLPVVPDATAARIFAPSLQLGPRATGATPHFAVVLRDGEVELVLPDGNPATADRAAELIGGDVSVELLPLEDAPPVLSSDIELESGSVCICIKVDSRKVGIRIGKK